MSATSRSARHPTGADIIFDPVKHEYLHAGEAFTSVTTLIKSYFPAFDGPAAAARKVAREGGCPQALIEQWERRRETAAAFGSRVHLFAETILMNNDPDAADALVENERERAFLGPLKATIARIDKYYEFIEAEKIVFSPRRKIAGTIDLLLRHRESGDYVVADWKTGRRIRQKAYGQETGTHIFAELPHCNHVHYSLQLGGYRELLLSEAYLPEGSRVRGVLIHLTDAEGRVACDFILPRELHGHVRAMFETRG